MSDLSVWTSAFGIKFLHGWGFDTALAQSALSTLASAELHSHEVVLWLFMHLFLNICLSAWVSLHLSECHSWHPKRFTLPLLQMSVFPQCVWGSFTQIVSTGQYLKWCWMVHWNSVGDKSGISEFEGLENLRESRLDSSECVQLWLPAVFQSLLFLELFKKVLLNKNPFP